MKRNPKHKKNPEVGTKETMYGPVVLVEQIDALSFGDQEEVSSHDACPLPISQCCEKITLMDWGNAIIRSKSISASGVIEALTADLHLEGDFKKTEKKVTWLADPASSRRPLVNVTLLDYDYLVTKKKLEEDDDVANFITPVTEFRVEAWADAGVKELQVGDIMQFERKGYYRVDAVHGTGDDMRLEFVRIPDGKAAGLASKSAPSAAAPPKAKAKGANGPNDAVPASSTLTAGGEAVMLSNGSSGFAIPVSTSMYKVNRVYGEQGVDPKSDTKMYAVSSVYDS